MQMQRLNELYVETNQLGFIGRLETDGAPVLEEACDTRRLRNEIVLHLIQVRG